MASNEPPTSPNELPAGPNEPHLSPEQIAAVDGALLEFKSALALSKGDPGRREAARSMRKVGFPVSAILTFSGNQWGESTIKNYVAGVRVDSGAPAARAVEFIGKALNENVTVEAIQAFLNAQTQLAPYRITIRDIAELLNMLVREGVQPGDFVNNYKAMVAQQLTPANLKATLDYKRELEAKGFGLYSLNAISETVKAFGEKPEKVLEALGKYGEIRKLEASLQDLQKKSTDASDQLRKLQEDDIPKSRDQLGKLNAQIQSAQGTLQSLEEVEKLGYDRQALQNLAAATSNLGGISAVLAAMKEYKRLDDLKTEIRRTEERNARLEKEKTEMETRNLHLKGHIDVVRTLISEPHNLTLDALESLLRTAKKYGPSETVFKAFEEYDHLQQLKHEQHELEVKIGETNDTLKQLQDQEKTLRSKIDELIPQLEDKVRTVSNAFETKLGELARLIETGVKNAEKKFNDTLDAEDRSVTVKFGEVQKSIDATCQVVNKAFTTLKDQVTAELKSVLDAAHEVDNAYEQRERKADEIKAFVELLNLVEDPASVTNARVMATTQLILSKLGIWLKGNQTRFSPMEVGFVTPSLVAESCMNLAKDLGRLSKVLKDVPAG